MLLTQDQEMVRDAVRVGAVAALMLRRLSGMGAPVLREWVVPVGSDQKSAYAHLLAFSLFERPPVAGVCVPGASGAGGI